MTVGKTAATKNAERNKAKKKVYEEDNVLNYEEEVEEEVEEEEEDSHEIMQTKKDEKTTWTINGWKINPRTRIIPGAHLMDPSAHLWNENSFIEYFMTFFQVKYTQDVMLPATNNFMKEIGWENKPFTYEEFVHFLGLLYMMEVVHLPECRMYWRTEPEGLFPALDFGKVMNLHRFEDFLNVWQLSESNEMDQQVLDFIDTVNANLKRAMRAGDVLCVDESMIKAYHKGLNGKMKTIRKPRPIGNKLKTVSDAATNIVLHMELHEAKEDMVGKDYVKEFGATTACSLRITEYWKGIYDVT